MAGTYIKDNGDIKEIDRVSIKDSNGDYRLVKKAYAKVQSSGGVYWQEVLESKPLYNIMLEKDTINIVSVENFETEKTINFSPLTPVKKVVYAGDNVYFHEYDLQKFTHKLDMTNLTLQEEYAQNWNDIDANVNGDVFFLSNDSIGYVDNQNNISTYQLTLQSGEEFTRFCADKDGFCYCLTTSDRFFKINPFTQTTEYSISLGIPPLEDANLTIDDENVYIDTDFNVILYVKKETGNEIQEIISTNAKKTFKASNLQDIVYTSFENSGVSKYNLATDTFENGYAIASGFEITDFDVSFNGNIYIIANDGTNYIEIKLNDQFQEIYNSGNQPISGSGYYRLGVFPGNFGAGFWDDYI